MPVGFELESLLDQYLSLFLYNFYIYNILIGQNAVLSYYKVYVIIH